MLRSKVPEPGMVEFSLDSAAAPQDGGLAALGASGRSDSVIAQADPTKNGFMAFAVYTVPEEFTRPGDEGRRDRPIGFRAVYTPLRGGNRPESRLSFKLVRPPLVMIHGLWSDAATWMFPLATDPRFEVTLADYAPSNAAAFFANGLIPRRYINVALTTERMRGTAATQVDVVAHSMGGLLSRNHASLPDYRRKDTFMAGDIHKLITLDTPHSGSPPYVPTCVRQSTPWSLV